MKPRRVLALVGLGLSPPDSLTGKTDEQVAEFKMEYDVVTALRGLGHEVRVLESGYELHKIREAIDEFKPHIAFNMLEDFHGHAVFDQNVVSYLELLKVPYTGCNPRGLMLAKDKALTKKILTYHRIRVPRFAVFARGRRIRARRNLKYPVIVKSLVEESSMGISQASIVKDDEQLKKRVEFVHEQIGSDAVAEEYVEGRELYVAILGNRRLQTFPIWELDLTNLPEGAPRIATAKVKYDLGYQDKYKIDTGAAKDLADDARARITHMCKRVFRTLMLSGYARLDLRVDAEGLVYVIEANPNPDISHDEDFAESAAAAGLDYDTLIQRVLSLGMRYHASWDG